MNQEPKHIHYFMKSLIAINILIIAAGVFLTPIWMVFMKHIHGNVETIGNAIAIFSVIIGVFTFIAGKIESVVKKDEMFLVVTQALFVIGYLGYFWISAPWQLYVVQMWLGVCGAFQSPAIYTLYQRYMPKETMSTAWGYWNGFYNISVGLGAFLSAYIAHLYGLNGAFTAMVAVAVLGLIIAMYVVRKIHRHELV